MHSTTDRSLVRKVARNPKPTTTLSRTRAALFGLAAAFACATTCQANQAYYQVQLQPGWNVIANQLNTGSNCLAEVLPWVPDGSEFYRWNAATHTYDMAFFDQNFGGWDNPTLSFAPGAGAFLLNPSLSPTIISFVGEIPSPQLPLHLTPGPPLLAAYQIPAPATCQQITGLPLTEGFRLYRFNPLLQADPFNLSNWQVYTFSGGHWSPGTPIANVGEAVYLQLPLNSTSNHPPVLPPIAPLYAHHGEQRQQQIVATDPDGNRLTYSIDPGSLPGVQINPTNGLLMFDSSLAPESVSNLVTVDVMDDGIPPLHTQQSIAVIVGAPIRIQSITQGEGDTTIVWNSFPGREYLVRSAHNLAHPVWDYRGSVVAQGDTVSWTESVNTDSEEQSTYYFVTTKCESCNCDGMRFKYVRDNRDKKASLTFDGKNPPEKAAVEVPLRVAVAIDCEDSKGSCPGHLNITATARWKFVDANGAVIKGNPTVPDDYDAGAITVEGGADVFGTCGKTNETQTPDVKLKASFDISGRDPTLRRRLISNPATAFLHVEFTITITTQCDGTNGPVQTVIVAVDGRADNPAAGIKGHFDFENSDFDADGKKGSGEPGATPDDRHKNDMNPAM